MTLRAAIYARYSTDLQSAASIEDQVRLCKERIGKEGWTPAHVYSDRGLSGASDLRPGYQKLLEDARKGSFDIIVAEALDRISRDQEHVAGFYKQLVFAGVKLVTLSEGLISELHVGLKGTMNALFLKDLADKTRRGLRGRVEQGRSGGGLCYGYDVVREIDANGVPVRGGRKINEAEADVVRRIFKEFAAGLSPRAIAKRLNAENVPGPFDRAWGDTTIRGHATRLTGILRNPLYAGRLVWNRLRYVKDPQSGKRLSRVNPEDAWVFKDAPELRIVEADLWENANSRLTAIHNSPRAQAIRKTEFWNHRRAKHLLTGRAFCGVCGGSMGAVGQDYLGCTAAHRKGACANRMTMRRDKIEDLILGALKRQLMAPDLVKVFIKEFHEEINCQRQSESLDREAQIRELKDVERKLGSLIDAIAEGIRSPGMKERLGDLESRKSELTRLIKDAPPPAPRLHPALADLYRDKVARLHEALTDPEIGHEAMEILRTLIEKVIVMPVEKGLEIELVGDIAGMVELAMGKSDDGAENGKAAPVGTALSASHRSSVKVVAGTGYQRYLRLWCTS
jgi:DNA invertase Pin-like site-specific DNA recombinase